MGKKWYDLAKVSKGVADIYRERLQNAEIEFYSFEDDVDFNMIDFEVWVTDEQAEVMRGFNYLIDLGEQIENVATEIIKEARDCGGKKSYDCELPPPTFERNDVNPWSMVRIALRERDEVKTAEFSSYGVFGEILFLDVELKTEEAPKPKIVGFIWKIEDDEYGDDAMCFSDEDYKTLMEIAERSKRH